MSLADRLKGIPPQRMGAFFEEAYGRQSRLAGIATTVFPDGCEVLPGGRLRRVRTPFDWVQSLNGKSAYIDTKTCGNYFNHSEITHHQVSELLWHEQHGVKAGYVIWLRKCDQVAFFHAGMLVNLLGKPGSIKDHTGGILLGGFDDFNPRKLFL